MKRKVNKILSNIILVLLIFVFLFSLIKLCTFLTNLRINKNLNSNIVKEVYKVVETETVDGSQEEPKKTFIIDFDKLLSRNPDVKGWIRYNGEKINYPILQGPDNDYYLKHSIDKAYNTIGCIFMDYRNMSFEDNNLVLYGHNMFDKTMFGSIGDLFKKGFFDNEENHYLEIMKPDNTLLTYQIFSYYVVEKEERYIQTKFDSTDDFNSFLDLIQKRSYMKFDVNVTIEDNILTLSTCHGYSIDTTERMVAHFKLISSEKIEV